MTKMPTGAELKAFRESKGLTQGELSRLVGSHSASISNIEAGRVGCGVGMLNKYRKQGFQWPPRSASPPLAAPVTIDDATELLKVFNAVPMLRRSLALELLRRLENDELDVSQAISQMYLHRLEQKVTALTERIEALGRISIGNETGLMERLDRIEALVMEATKPEDDPDLRSGSEASPENPH